ncbi:hypothetical protein [Glutamicibacter creatinolyticus]|uniref:hypothetical protein n=1 Tax=Glutamicibacter creatinolyticus TaxID=162496 RepID=UPI0037BF8E9A
MAELVDASRGGSLEPGDRITVSMVVLQACWSAGRWWTARRARLLTKGSAILAPDAVR